MHDFVGLHGVGFLDADENEVVEGSFGRERNVHQFREVHLQDGQKQANAGRAKIKIFHRRLANDGAGIHSVPAVSYGGEMEGGIFFGQGVIASMVAERAFVTQRLSGSSPKVMPSQIRSLPKV